MTSSGSSKNTPIRYRITGSAALSRLRPLLPPDWVPAAEEEEPDFLWENAPRYETRPFRDRVRCYSHLPNGTAILDNKWVLARLFAQFPCSLVTHCFRGVSGFRDFCDTVGLLEPAAEEESTRVRFPDLFPGHDTKADEPLLPLKLDNWWVVKDASSNGAGGIWVLGPENAATYAQQSSTPLMEEHAYVAQKYAWPMTLYKGRKFHVRVYGLLTADGRAFVHRRAFLHVANQPLTHQKFEDAVHITNCCANSHDPDHFSGEICADLLLDSSSSEEGVGVVPLGAYWPSIQASVAHLAQKTCTLVQGGQANNGFEYLGIDFLLHDSKAYLLEVNAPPSQDTATGLPHAEELHNTVLGDILTLWVYPHVLPDKYKEEPGGWHCVHQPTQQMQAYVLPSKAAILNKMRWAIFERKNLRADQEKKQLDHAALTDDNDDTHRVRQYFPYFNDENAPVFMESGGGAQVPRQVFEAMRSSLQYRDRSVRGVQSAQAARDTLRTLLGAQTVFLGPNATALLGTLAMAYKHLLKPNDEIVISTENHLANVKPWLDVANDVGALVKWWKPSSSNDPKSCLEDLLTPRTRIVAVPHASNVLGQVRDVADIQQTVNRLTRGYGHTIVDGVTAAPHCFAKASDVDWYVVSCHKLFGPHIGVLCGRHSVVQQLCGGQEKKLEVGTMNYEACEGVVGLGHYFSALSTHSQEASSKTFSSPMPEEEGDSLETIPCREDHPNKLAPVTSIDAQVLPPIPLNEERAKAAYQFIQAVETPLTRALLEGLERAPKVRIVRAPGVRTGMTRLPVVCFTHTTIPSDNIVKQCRQAGILCRHGAFLSTGSLFDELGVDAENGVVRFSLAHYNTLREVRYALKVLESITGWL
jgi:selenocysteine lyase/cysteine desulfurase